LGYLLCREAEKGVPSGKREGRPGWRKRRRRKKFALEQRKGLVRNSAAELKGVVEWAGSSGGFHRRVARKRANEEGTPTGAGKNVIV